MADPPPDADPNVVAAPPQGEAQASSRRWLRRVVLLLPTAAAVIGAWWLATQWEKLRIDNSPIPPARGDLAYTDSAQPTPAAWQTLLTEPMDADPLALNPARRPLDAEPADLPPFPGDAEHESRFRVADGSIVDEVSFWRVRGPASAEAVAGHYRQAAAAAGFTELLPAESSGARPDRPAATSLLFVDDQRHARLLTVRVRPQDNGCHVVIWLRYGTDPP